MYEPIDIARAVNTIFLERGEFRAGKIIRDWDDSPELCADMTIRSPKTGKEYLVPAKFCVSRSGSVTLIATFPDVSSHNLPAIYNFLNTLNDEYDPKFYVTFPLHELRIRETVCSSYPEDAEGVGMDAYRCWQTFKNVLTCCIDNIDFLLNN